MVCVVRYHVSEMALPEDLGKSVRERFAVIPLQASCQVLPLALKELQEVRLMASFEVKSHSACVSLKRLIPE